MSGISADAKEIFLDALEARACDLEALIDERCGADAGLRAQVDRLLVGHRRSDTVFGTAVPPPAAIDALRPGLRIGSFALVEEIGEGGFAVVWRAQQLEPVRRSVALKVLKAGMDTREVVQRFEAERQALALMDHPGIARVFDGGATEAGRPWFAMELVEGLPITEFCEQHGLSKEARLALFGGVCRAVQHAHQKGVIHRDLKPSNVLVGRLDGQAVAKVIDFGIAKAIESSLTEHSIRTLAGQVIGTPAYMSPEQADDSMDVDTRSDVYALGALLYEVLSGEQPFGEQTLHSANLSEILRIIREDDPPRPSTRMGARTRMLARDVRGDLDWIVMRCLEKDRDRRYDSAGSVANEIERHLAGEPVLAGPPDVGYRVRKFVRRHRLSLGVSAVFVGLLIAAVIVSSTLMVRARRAERDLVREAGLKETELAKFQSIASFLESVLMGVEPAYAQGADTELLQRVLAQAARRVEADSGGVEEVEATLRRVIGGAYLSLSQDALAEEQLLAALEIRERLLAPGDPHLLESRLELGSLYLAQARLAEAEPLLLGALDGSSIAQASEEQLEGLTHLAVLQMDQGRFDEAEATLGAIEATRLERYGEAHRDSIRAINNMATVLQKQGRRDEAVERLARAAELQLEVQGHLHPDTMKAYTNLGGLLVEMGRGAEGAGYLESALEWKREVLPDGDRSLLVSLNSLARLHQADERYEEAERYFLEAREMIARTETEATPNAIILLYNHAGFLAVVERGEEAEAEYARAATLARQTFGPAGRFTLLVDSALAWQLHLDGKGAEAEPLVRSVVQRARAAEAPVPADLGVALVRHGIVLLDLDRGDEGLAALREGLPIAREQELTQWVERGEQALGAAGLSE